MPYDINPYNTRVKEKSPQTGGLALGPAGSTGSAGAPAPTASVPTAPQAQGGTGFVNFDRIFNGGGGANAASGAAMAQNVTNSVQGKVDAYQNAVGEAEKGFGDAVKAGINAGPTTAPTQTYAGYDPKAGGSHYSYANDAAFGAAPTDFRAWAAENATTLPGQQDAARQALDSTKDYYGVQANLQNQYGARGNYGSGASRWDAALAGTAGMGGFDALRSKYANLGSIMDAAAGRANASAQGAITNAQNTTAANATQASADAGASYAEEQRKRREQMKKDTGGGKRRGYAAGEGY